MKVVVKRVFFDDKGLHRKGDKIEVNYFDENLMTKIEEPKVEEPKKKTIKK